MVSQGGNDQRVEKGRGQGTPPQLSERGCPNSGWRHSDCTCEHWRQLFLTVEHGELSELSWDFSQPAYAPFPVISKHRWNVG